MKRRDFIEKSLILSPLLFMPKKLLADDSQPNAISLEQAIDIITDDLPLNSIEKSKRVRFVVPKIAENGAVVPVSIEVAKTTKEALAVKAIYLFNSKEPNPRCAEVFYLKPSTNTTIFKTRVKIESSQVIIVLVELLDGSFIKMDSFVRVVIHNCV